MARMDNGADYEIFKHEIENNPERSNFNLSYLHTFTQDFGELRPFYLEETIPGDKFTISNDILCRVQAMEVPIMSNIRIYTHYYYSRCNELWSRWEDFCTRGRSGNYTTIRPRAGITIQTNNTYLLKDADGTIHGWFDKDSLANALGLPILQYKDADGTIKPTNTKTTSFRHSMLPFFMYQRIYRDYYMNANINENDRLWYPENEYEFILGESKDDDAGLDITLPTTTYQEQAESASRLDIQKSEYSLYTMRYRNWRDDYFTSAMPWPQRGKEPYIEFPSEEHIIPALPVKPSLQEADNNSKIYLNANGGGYYYNREGGISNFPDGTTMFVGNQKIPLSLNARITMESLRKLTTMQLWQERNARVRTSGNYYNNMIRSHFGHDPHAKDNTPTFIGGTVQDISVSEILQTSQTDEETGNALGQAAGHGISAASGYVGEFTCPDYGYIMGIMSIVPDVTYAEGLDRLWTRETFSDIYYPEFNGLGAQGILKQELKLEGSQTENTELWAYQERNAEYKHRRNRISGDIANKKDKYYSAYTMARFFEERPEFNQEFVTTKGNVSKRSFTFTEEKPFVVQVANIIKATRKMPYLSQPKGLI